MTTTNLNIRTDKELKNQAERVFNELGLNMTTAINVFLKAVVREQGIPFELKLDVPNEMTAHAIKEGRDLIDSSPKYSSIEELKNDLDK